MIKLTDDKGNDTWIDYSSLWAMKRIEPKKIITSLIDPTSFDPYTILYSQSVTLVVKETPEEIQSLHEEELKESFFRISEQE